MTCPTKTAALFELLKRQWVTPLISVNKVGLLSLSQRCGQFRRAGHVVLDKWVKTSSGSKVKAYRLVK